jgi:ABC-type lipoprotein release transport system permease subunit
MNNYRVAWRNLWRNRRRTLITVASVFFAVFLALVMRSLQLGTYGHMFRNMIESYTGYLQVQHRDFSDTRTIDNIFMYERELEDLIMGDANTAAIIPRFESFALASSGMLTKGVIVLGIDPEKESYLSDIREKLVKYRLTGENNTKLREAGLTEKYASKLDFLEGRSYSGSSGLLADLGISDDDTAAVLPLVRKHASFDNGYFVMGEDAVLLGDRLATFLKAGIGDTLVLIGQGYQGTTAAGRYKINGIVRVPAPDLDNKIVYIPFDVARELYNAPGMLTSIVVGIKNSREKEIDRMIESTFSSLPPDLRALDWREMNELMINQLDADSKSGLVMIAILYLVIAFGIFGTVLMMTAERRREFGVLVAIGMQKTRLAAVVVIEMLYMGLMGVVSGALAALPVVIFGYRHPMRFSGDIARTYEAYGMEPVLPMLPPDWYFLWQTVIVAVIVLIAMVYPVRKILKLEVVHSIKP